jgi:hypothetical protein
MGKNYVLLNKHWVGQESDKNKQALSPQLKLNGMDR